MNKLDEKMKKLIDYGFLKLYGTDYPPAPIETAIFDYGFLVPSRGERSYSYIPDIKIIDERDAKRFLYRPSKDFAILLNKFHTDVFGNENRENRIIISDCITFAYNDNYIVVESNTRDLSCFVLKNDTSIKFVESLLKNKINITEDEFNKLLNLFKEFEETNGGKNFSFCRYIFDVNKDNIDTVLDRIDLRPENIKYRQLNFIDINENTFRIAMGYRDDLFAPTEYFEFILEDDIKEKFKTYIMLEMSI